MIETIDEALLELMNRRNMTLGIEGLLNALKELNNPQEVLKTIHIGGTNGKGSTTDFVRSILEHNGYKVGTFTSPHLRTHNDRIRVHNLPIEDNRLLAYINQTYRLWDQYQLSMFEIDMLISLLYFVDEKVDWVVYEVGLGGRLDATNVIHPVVAAITNVDYDHMSILGNTLREIATEKAGIIKPGIKFLTTEKKHEPLAVLKEKCLERNVDFEQVPIPEYKVIQDEIIFTFKEQKMTLFKQASYQVENATLALAIVDHLGCSYDLTKAQQALYTTHWEGRFEEVLPHVYLDGAHNILGVEKLIESIKRLPKPWTVLFTALADKEHHEMVRKLVETMDEVIITEFDFYRAAPVEKLAEGFNVTVIKDKNQALDYIIHKQEGTKFITGSLYFISEVKEIIEKTAPQ